MSRTIGRRWQYWPAPNGGTANCDYCGAKWPRAELSRDAAGLLVCPDEGPGRTALELDLANEAGSRTNTEPAWVDGVARRDFPIEPRRIFGDDLLHVFRADQVGAAGTVIQGSGFPSVATEFYDGAVPWTRAVAVSGNPTGEVYQGPNRRAALRGGVHRKVTNSPGLSAGSALSAYAVLSTASSASFSSYVTFLGRFSDGAHVTAASITAVGPTSIRMSARSAITGPVTVEQGKWVLLVAVWRTDAPCSLLVDGVRAEGLPSATWTSSDDPSGIQLRTLSPGPVAEMGIVDGDAELRLSLLQAYAAYNYGVT